MRTAADTSTSQENVDCIIIGGGPAGLTAATYLGRFLRNCVVIDAERGVRVRFRGHTICRAFQTGLVVLICYRG